MSYQHAFMLPVIVGLLATATAHADSTQEMTLDVGKNGEAVIVNADIVMPGTPAEVWEVLTDFNRMAEFLPNIRYSKIIDNHDNLLQVEQSGKASYGPFSFSFQFVREIVLTPPREMRSHVLKGNFHRMDSRMQLVPEGADTRILYHSESVPNFLLPPGIAVAVTEKTTRGQFEAMKAEILRRKGLPQK
jgi:ribosome-associated toxin RatA of RatAB toxin-antitoxin module